ncbi:MAG: AtpZ/AtpI family protein [Sphaerobacter sp.]|nr:AtpZ/AtpI family protein [Sphaerobacter sp.]
MAGPPGERRSSQRDWRAIGTASGLGCSTVVSLLLCILGGLVLDRWLGTLPLFTLVGVGLGIATAGYLLYELAVVSRPDKGLKRTRGRDAIERPAKPNEEEP